MSNPSAQPASSDSLASMCWPIIQQHKPLSMMEKVALSRRPVAEQVSWPVSEPWRRNLGQPRCAGEGRCQGNAQRCNSKYRYGVDDVGQCPKPDGCGVTCTPCPPPCPDPCPDIPGCHRLSTRCFDWPRARVEGCLHANPNDDVRGPRANLNASTAKPQVCPTCKRAVVDMECGPIGYNY